MENSSDFSMDDGIDPLIGTEPTKVLFKKVYFNRKDVLQDLMTMVPKAFLLEYQTRILFKSVCQKYHLEENEDCSMFKHRMETQMTESMNILKTTIEKLASDALKVDENPYFGIHWSANWIDGVAKNFVYCMISSFCAKSNLDDILINGNIAEKRGICEKALKGFQNHLSSHHVNKFENSLLNRAIVYGNTEKEKKQRRKFLSAVTIEKYVAQAQDFFVILGLLPVSCVSESHRPLSHVNLNRRPKHHLPMSPKGRTGHVLCAILETDIYRYIDKCLDIARDNYGLAVLPKGNNSIRFIADDGIWIKLDDFYKWLLLIFVQATVLKSQSVVGTSDDATGALKIRNVCITSEAEGLFKLVVRITRLHTVPDGENIILYSSNKKYCPVKMMMIWLAVRNCFKMPFKDCLTTNNFEIKEECLEEWLFPESDQNGGIKTRVWSCNVIANAVEHFAKVMNLQNFSVGTRSLRKGRVVEIFCGAIRGGFNSSRSRLCVALKNLPGWDNDNIFSQINTPLYNDRSLCQTYDQLAETFKKAGKEPPNPLEIVPSMVDVAEIIIPKDFDKTYEYLKMFDEYYLQKFKHAEIELLQAKIDFLTTKENESSNPYSANRLERLKKTLNYRLSPSHKSDCKPKFRQKWLFSKYSKQTGLASHKKVIYTDEGNMLNLTEISGRRENFVEHCVGEIQGLSEQICAYKNIKCPIKGCGKENVDAKHVESHKVFECSLCVKTKQFGNLKAFKKHYTSYHILTHYCILCDKLCSESPPHKRICSKSVAVNRKYIHLFFSDENKSLACGCLTEKCIKDNPKVVKAFNFATLHAVAALCFYEDFEKEPINCMKKVFTNRITGLVGGGEKIECIHRSFTDRIQIYMRV